MEFKESRSGDIVVLSLKGKLDLSTSESFEEKMSALIKGNGKNIILELSELAYISSSGFKTLLTSARELIGSGGNLILCSLSSHVKQLFEVTGFSTIFVMCDSVEEAIQTSRTTKGPKKPQMNADGKNADKRG